MLGISRLLFLLFNISIQTQELSDIWSYPTNTGGTQLDLGWFCYVKKMTEYINAILKNQHTNYLNNTLSAVFLYITNTNSVVLPCCCKGWRCRCTWEASQYCREQWLGCWHTTPQWLAGDQCVDRWRPTDEARGRQTRKYKKTSLNIESKLFKR